MAHLARGAPDAPQPDQLALRLAITHFAQQSVSLSQRPIRECGKRQQASGGVVVVKSVAVVDAVTGICFLPDKKASGPKRGPVFASSANTPPKACEMSPTGRGMRRGIVGGSIGTRLYPEDLTRLAHCSSLSCASVPAVAVPSSILSSDELPVCSTYNPANPSFSSASSVSG